MATCAETYIDRMEHCTALIEKLSLRLLWHREQFQKNPNNWGFPGDIAHIVSVIGGLGIIQDDGITPDWDDAPHDDDADADADRRDEQQRGGMW